MHSVFVSLAAAALALAGSAAAKAHGHDDTAPPRALDMSPGTVWAVVDLRDVDRPNGMAYVEIQPTIGATFAGPANSRIGITFSRRQIVDPIWHGTSTTLTLAVGGRF